MDASRSAVKIAELPQAETQKATGKCITALEGVDESFERPEATDFGVGVDQSLDAASFVEAQAGVAGLLPALEKSG